MTPSDKAPSLEALRGFAELELLYRSAPIGLALIDRELRHVRINDRLAAMNGRPAAEHIGRTIFEMAPAIASDLARHYRQIFATGEPVLNVEIHALPTPSLPVETDSLGQYYPVKAADGSVVAISVIVVDITKHKRAEVERRQVFERITDAFVALDRDWHCTYLNTKAGQLWDLPPAELVGRHFWTEFPDGVGRRFQPAYAKAMADQQPATLEEYHPALDRWFENRAFPAPEGLSIYFHDITERKKNEALLKGQKDVLVMVAGGAPLGETLSALLRVIEAQSPDMLCSILLLDPEGVHLRHGAAPSLPPAYMSAIDGRAIGPKAGSCGTAAFRRAPVIVDDITLDPLWDDYRAVALAHGLRACWSTPIFDAKQQVLGTFAIYYRRPGRPSAIHEQLIEIATHTAAVAVGRQLVETTARELGARLTTTLENMDAGFFTVDRTWRFTYLNKQSEYMLRRTRAELLGKRLWDEFKEAVGSTSDREYHRAMAENRAVAFEDYFAPLDRWFEVSGYPSSDGLAVYFRDITERKQVAEKLRESDERFRQLAENINEVFWVRNPDEGEMLYVSPAYERIWGRTCASLYGNPHGWVESIHPEDCGRAREAATRAKTDASDENFRIVRPDGSVRWIRDRAFPVRNSDGKVHRIVGVAGDITERKNLEEQFFRAQRLEAIGTLASGVAHDLNNILAPVLMAAGLLKDKMTSPRDLAMLTLVENSAQRGASIVGQLLTFSRGSTGERAEVQPRHFIKEMVQIMRETFPRNIEIGQEVASDLWCVVADATQLHQVLMNLCVNARDAMPDGGRLTVAARNARPEETETSQHRETRPGPHVVLTVVDTGGGIPPGIVDRIFDPFFTTKGVGKGTGLGLSTVSGIVKSHGGFVLVDSEVGRGTAFKVYIPATGVSTSSDETGSTSPIPIGHGELVLLVDDEAPIRETTAQVLQTHGYRVLVAENGEAAIKLFISHIGSVRLVVTDVMMPVMGGLELARSLHVLDSGVKIVATSGMGEDDKRKALLDAGVIELLSKPYAPALLLKKVSQLIGTRT